MPRPASPNGRTLSPTLSTALAALLAALALLPRLGARALTDWDEAIYAEVAREMLRFGALVPHWNYGLWLEKPPLAMWLTAVLYRILGVNEFAARACSALSGVATVALLHAFLARTRSTLAAWLSTAILLGTFGFLHSCHTGEVDILLAFTCTLSLLGLARIPASPRSGWVLFWTGFALSAMTKGAASIVLPLTAAAFAAIPPRPLRLTRHLWPGFAVFLFLVLPWHLVMLHRFGSLFLHEYLGFHVLTRSTHQIEGHTTHWWFYLKVLFVAAPPFALLYPSALTRALRPRTPNADDASLQPWAFFALITLGLYTLVQTRLPQYIVPAYPALALLTAVYLAERLAPLLALPHPTSFWTKRAAAAIAISAAMVSVTAPARKALHSPAPASPTAVAPLDSKDSIVLLRRLRREQPALFADTPGALLLWRPARISSIATDVFYARRAVLQLQRRDPQSVPPDQPRDRYLFDPIPFDNAALTGPQLILLDRSLVSNIPATFTYTPIAAQGAVEIGRITPLPPSSR